MPYTDIIIVIIFYTLCLFQIEKIEFKQISSNRTQLMNWTWTTSTVLSNTDFVLYGRETESSPPTLYIYTAGGQYKNTLPRVCEHEKEIKLLALNIQGQEYLCVSCMLPPSHGGCGQIYTINIKNGKVAVAYQRDGHYPAHMCTGKPGVLYVHHCVKGEPILELDCSRLPFTYTGRTIQSGMELMYDMCYSSHPQPGMLIFTNPITHNVRAVSVDSSQSLWEIRGGDTIGNPHGVTPSNNGCIILADGNKKKLVVIRSRDGKVINTHHVENCGVAADPFLINNQQQLGLHYDYQGKECIALFQVK